MSALRKIFRQTRAATVLIFALCLLPLLGFLGLAIDFGMVTMARAQLDTAADAAALKAVTAAASAYQANPNSNFLATGQTAGLAYFQAQLGSMTFGAATSPTLTVTGGNGKFNATLTAQASVPTMFAQAFGLNNFVINDTSVTSLTDPQYVAIQILIDTSASMGILTDTTNNPPTLLANIKTQIAAEFGNKAPVGGNLLVAASAIEGIISVNNYVIKPTAAPNGQCAFACHFDGSTSGPNGKSDDFYGVAEASGLQLRIDVVRSAVEEIIQQVQSSNDAAYFQFGIYGFADSLTTVFPMSTDLVAAYAAAAKIDVTTLTPYCSYGGTVPLCGDSTADANPPGWGFRYGAVPDTKFEASTQTLINTTLTPKPTSNGISAATPLRYMFIITDGVDDYTTNTALNVNCCNQYIYPFNASDGYDGGAASGASVCDQIKAAGVTILVLYTPYNSVAVPTYYNEVQPLVEPLANSKVTTALQNCASAPADYFLANSPSEIQSAMTKMLAIASAKVGHFTQ